MIGDRLKALRISKNWTTRQLAEKINVSHVMISEYEKNKSVPRPRVLKALSEAFELPTSEILGEKQLGQDIPFNPKAFDEKFARVKQRLDVDSKKTIEVIFDRFLELEEIKESMSQFVKR